MAMSDGINSTRLHKIAFQLGDKWFRFAINPENYIHRKPHRTAAIKTKSRIIVQDFQEDIQTISISGTTGWNPTGRREDRGFLKIKEMKNYLETYANSGGDGRLPAQDFYFHNYTNGESFVVHLSPEGVTFTQDVSSPLTYRYEINLVVIRKAGEPSEDEIVDPEIGNRFPSIPRGSGGLNSPYPIHPTDDSFDHDPYIPGTGTVYSARQTSNTQPINPQAPSVMSYTAGTTALGYALGYYGRYN